MTRSTAVRHAAAALVLVAGVLARDARASGGTTLNGFVPANKAPVGALSLPEVHPGRSGAPFHFKAAPGHMLFVYFGYTSCPDVCPTTLSDLKRALLKLGDDAKRVDVAFITVDPDRDVAKVLAPYLDSFVHGGHPLRPPTRQELDPVQRAFGAASSVARTPSGTIEVTHSALSYVVNDRGEIVDEWPFGTTPAVMAADLKILLGRARS